MSKEVLYVAYQWERMEEEFSYALYMCKTLSAKLRILFLEEKALRYKLECLTTAITFAEAGQYQRARDIVNEEEINKKFNDLCTYIIKWSNEERVNINIHYGFTNIITAINEWTKKNKNIVEMVILSPIVTQCKGVSAKKITRVASIPVITMHR